MKPLDPRLRPHLAPASRPLAGVVAAGVVGGALVIAQAFAVAALVVTLIDDPSGSGWRRPALALLGIGVGRAAMSAFGTLAADRAAAVITGRLRRTVVRAGFDLGALGLARRRDGELGLLATRGVDTIEPYVTRYLPALILAAVLPVLTLIAIWTQDAWAGLTVLVTLPLVPVFAILIGLATKDRADRQYRTLALLAGHFVDVVRGLPTLVVFNRAGNQLYRIRVVTDHYRRATMATLRLAFVSSGALELVATLSVALVAVNVGLRLASGNLGLYTALVVLLLAPEAYWPLRRVGAEFHAAAEGMATFEAIDDLLAEVPTTADPDEAPVTAGAIRLNGVSYTYPTREAPAVRVPPTVIDGPGLTAITGPSGCGKSTLLQLLLGELEPTSGSITIGGRVIPAARLRELVAQVPQTPWLTPASIAANLRIPRPDSTEADLWEALAAVDLADAVRALPDGLDTELGEDGAGLSAGQRARLALARVIIADRPFVLLDEPTAHLDADTEAILVRTLSRLATRATVIAVAHSDAVVAAADSVITLTPPIAGTDEPAEPTVARRPPRQAGQPIDANADLPPRLATLRYAIATVLGTGASLSGIALTATAGWLIVRASEHPPILYLMVAIVGVRAFGLARPVLRYAERLVSHDVALRLLADTRARVYEFLIPLVPARLGRRRGDLLSTVVDDVDSHLDRELRVRQPILVWLGTSIVVSTIGWFLDPRVGVVIGSVAGVGGLVAMMVAWIGSRRTESRLVTARAELSGEIVTTLESARQLVLWGADDVAVERISEIDDRMDRAGRGTARSLAAAGALTTILASAGVIAVAQSLVGALTDGTVSGPIAALLVLIPLALSDVLSALPEAASLAVRTRSAQRRLTALEQMPAAVTEPEVAFFPLDPLREVDLRDVSAGWDHPDTAAGSARGPVLRNLDLNLAAGKTVGVVGPSGSGKSTLAAILLRFLQPWTGEYLLGGHDTNAMGSDVVRHRVSLVDDDPYIFGSTLRENLRLANPYAGDEDLVEALERAGLSGWFDLLPHGLDTLLGDGADSVSGGERARIGIARVLLRDPHVLVLDEPTAHLDSATAQRVRETLLARMSTGRTLIWITHDDSVLPHLDNVLDLGTDDRRYAGSAL